MDDIRFRLAKPNDAASLANCHWHVRDRYSQGIFLSLGKSFLRSYYKVILNDPNEVVVCAEHKTLGIVGFCNATLDARAQANTLKKHKFSLGLSALWAIICKPSLFKAVWERYNSLSANNGAPSFVHTEGVRGEYWCWMKEAGDSFQSVNLNQALKNIVGDLGIKEMYSEVDKFNKHVYKFLTMKKNIEVLEEITLPDGRERALLLEHLEHKPINLE